MVGPHPDIRWQFQRNCTSASAPAPASRYPSAAAGILRYPPSKGPATDRLEGLPSSRGYPLGYPDTRQQFAEKGPSAPESAPAGGYPLAQAGIRQTDALRPSLSSCGFGPLDPCWRYSQQSGRIFCTQWPGGIPSWP
ncbi:hypothetical protein PGT21_025684 [Puccinia graminis f. sp. tritici]|uniref:Uncharacterized protein n=1 Tax=Puccinia graminis f. sp. tritici TaxID=56615 RepID=A0A5B0MCU2_PUCGR|nr:hypothetical protein PGT21_025684 [Puccinia graminis f. sp. tritici]